ncbi:MAG: class I SAM-dependent methyltransferase [Chloroflexota bacterium]|nr:class I SAM-dependent methyltransferase [Chloroflexota bacterium]
MPYSASDYWTDLHRRDDISAVGQSALPPAINRWLYRILARNLRAFLGRTGLVAAPPARMFDAGSGTGEWLPFWRELGIARIDGCDFVPAAVDRLNTRHGSTGTFSVAELGRPDGSDLPTGERYPLVTVMNVLLHITDDERFAAAIGQIAELVEPGGLLLLVEPILLDPTFARPFDPAMTSRARSLDDYARPCRAAGLEQVVVAAATVLANNPIEAGSERAYLRYLRAWRWLARRTKRSPASARWIGPLLMTADGIAMRTGAAPTSKLALFRRPR